MFCYLGDMKDVDGGTDSAVVVARVRSAYSDTSKCFPPFDNYLIW